MCWLILYSRFVSIDSDNWAFFAGRFTSQWKPILYEMSLSGGIFNKGIQSIPTING